MYITNLPYFFIRLSTCSMLALGLLLAVVKKTRIKKTIRTITSDLPLTTTDQWFCFGANIKTSYCTNTGLRLPSLTLLWKYFNRMGNFSWAPQITQLSKALLSKYSYRSYFAIQRHLTGPFMFHYFFRIRVKLSYVSHGTYYCRFTLD